MSTTQSRIRKLAATAVAAVGLSVGVVAMTATPASAATYLGGVSMQRACNLQYPGMGLTAKVTDPNSAYSWRCKSSWGYSGEISVYQECVSEYGNGAYSREGSRYNPYSWGCYR